MLLLQTPSISCRGAGSPGRSCTNVGAADSRGGWPIELVPQHLSVWSPAIGEQHGYYDEFREDGRFYYTGAGQYGDQRLRDANRVLLNHVQDGRRVHLFAGAGGVVEYVTELVLDRDEPLLRDRGPETGDGPLRRVYVFQFDLVGTTSPPFRSKLDGVIEPGVEEVPLENRWTQKFFVNPSAAEQYEAERREQALVLGLEAYLRRQGHDATRLKIVPPR